MQTLIAFPDRESVESPQDDMPLNETDKAWIREAIRDANKSQGWGAFKRFVKDWSGFGAAVTILVFAATQWTAYVEFRTTTTDAIKGINRRLDSSADVSRLEKITLLPIDKSGAEAARKVITDAKTASLNIPTDVVQSVGQKLVEASAIEPAAWQATAAFLDYKSSMNGTAFPVPSLSQWKEVPLPLGPNSGRDLPGGPPPRAFIKGKAPTLDTAAVFELIGTDVNDGQGEEILLAGGTVGLDGIHMRKVVLRGVHVIYNGGPIQLENVIFVDCVFEMKYGRNTQNLALAALVPSPATTFSAS
jgi:hypothetical protein